MNYPVMDNIHKITTHLINSPCVRNCCLNEDDNCLGCFRSLEEITLWSTASDDDRKKILTLCDIRRIAYDIKWKRK